LRRQRPALGQIGLREPYGIDFLIILKCVRLVGLSQPQCSLSGNRRAIPAAVDIYRSVMVVGE
jgi:hypothetical protein